MAIFLVVLVASLLGAAFFAGTRIFFVIQKHMLAKRHKACGGGRNSADKESVAESRPRIDITAYEAPNPRTQTGGEDMDINADGPIPVEDMDVEEPRPVRSTVCRELNNVETFRDFWPSVSSGDQELAPELAHLNLQSLNFSVPSKTSNTFAVPVLSRRDPSETEIALIHSDMPALVLPSLMHPSVISAGLRPSEVLADCFAILLREVQQGSCTQRGFDSFFRLMREVDEEDRNTLEKLLGSAIIFLLTLRMTDETFKNSGRYEEAFTALVQLLDNRDVLTMTMQPDFKEVIDSMEEKGILESKDGVIVFALRPSGIRHPCDEFGM